MAVDGELWAAGMLEKSESPPPFYSTEFHELATDILMMLGLSVANITHENCKDIYVNIISLISPH